jgi:hypothetical protein
MWATFVTAGKQIAQRKNRPLGENSPNLVTLSMSYFQASGYLPCQER